MQYIGNKTQEEIFQFYNELNNEESHYTSNDDICTNMECVKKMLDYLPDDFWAKNQNILDPCCGNGNFGVYAQIKSPNSNIYYNELNPVRYDNCKILLNPEHISCCDFFEITNIWNMKWDLIMANPPYSGGANKNRSLFIRFIDYSIDLLNEGGYLCYVVPNSWMTYNNDNKILHRLLTEGSFIVIDNDVKHFFPGVGSSFCVFVWQKGVLTNKTTVVNSYLIKDTQTNIVLPKDLPFIPLYVSQEIIELAQLLIDTKSTNSWNYRCDLHNHTQKKLLSDTKSSQYPYETVHTARKTRYASKKQEDIYDKYLVITPLSTYFVPFIKHNVNVTQSVGYIACDTEEKAKKVCTDITRDIFIVLIHLTRYGNFNNIMVLKHLKFGQNFNLSKNVQDKVYELRKLIKY